MKTFKDCEGREWQIAINIATLKRVKETLNFDLLDVAQGKELDRLITDPYLLVNVLYVLCKPQADEHTITDEQFGEGMAGDAIEDATTAMLEELVNFSRRRLRPALTKAMQKMNELEEKAAELIEKMLDDPKIIENLERTAEKLLESGSPSTGSPES